ncbi:hypothetical protein PoB_003285200 [Plakobranchus ocellatus]|uniref:Uncharacterized protein n=1 Tax=Plakobranchus ocellatus TaxID=259542 RepID=A0AAV4AH37_9GAST|nr:hypothetical protein PoB_003285200 [Plakobranchus ocellatus]
MLLTILLDPDTQILLEYWVTKGEGGVPSFGHVYLIFQCFQSHLGETIILFVAFVALSTKSCCQWAMAFAYKSLIGFRTVSLMLFMKIRKKE